MNIPQSAIEPFEPLGIPPLRLTSTEVDYLLAKIYDELDAYADNKLVCNFPVMHFISTFRFGISISAIPKLVKSWKFSWGGQDNTIGTLRASEIIVKYTLSDDSKHIRKFFVHPGGEVW